MAYDAESDQVTNIDAVPSIRNAPYDKGKVQAMVFSYTVPAGNLASGRKIELLRMPKGAKILSGWVANDILTTSGNETLALGDGTTVDLFLLAVAVVTAGARGFSLLRAAQQNLLLANDTSLVATVGGNPWLAGGVISGYVLYVKD